MDTTITDLARRLGDNMTTGGRVPVVPAGSPLGAFGWAAQGPSTIIGAVQSAGIAGGNLGYLRVDRTGVPASVPEGGTKPDLATVTAETKALVKYAGLSSFPIERSVFSNDAIIPVIADTLYSQVLLAADADAWATLTADAGLAGTPGTAWSGAILEGIGKVVQAGGRPDLLVMSAVDYAAAVDSPTGSGYAMSGTDAQETLFGLRIVIAAGAGASTGTAFVADSRALLAVEDSGGPIGVLDVSSGLSTNAVRLAIELFAAFVVTLPGSVCGITVTAAPLAASKK